MGEVKTEYNMSKIKHLVHHSDSIKGMTLNNKINKGRHPSRINNNMYCMISSFAIAGWLTLQCLAISSQAAEISGK